MKPVCDSRIVAMRLLTDLLHQVHSVWFPDLKLSEAIGMTLIVNRVVFAQLIDKPITLARLARELQITRPTMMKRLRYLVRRGLVTRDGQRITLNGESMKTAQADRSIKRTRQLIMDAGKKLTDIGVTVDQKLTSGKL